MNTAWITLGRYGDCINTLPLVLEDYNSGNRPTFVVSKTHADLFEGIGYCDVLPWDGEYSRPMEAFKWVESLRRFDQIYISQCYGTQHKIECSSFAEEAWRLVGAYPKWGRLPLIFDLRNKVRELDLVNQIRFSGKPVILISASGISSPFPHRDELFKSLEPLGNRYDIIDLSTVRAKRFYDLLGLYEKASCLISTDTGTLHLAQACPELPVIALVTNSPTAWHGSPSRPNHMLRIRYNEFQKRKNEIVDLLSNPIKFSQPRLIHVWNDYYGRTVDADRRHQIAKASWELEYASGPWVPCPIFDEQLDRNGMSVGAHKPVPFVNDLINAASSRANPNDIICLTNDDTIFVEGISKTILEHSPCWSGRYEHNHVQLPVTQAKLRVNSYKHVGADVFAFSNNWWIENRQYFPDMLVSMEAWDLVLRKLIDSKGGKSVDGLCAHIIHNPEWHSAKFRECAANIFNRNAARGFFSTRGGWPNV